MRVYYDRDADVNLIKDKKVAIIGYGSQGHAHANNLRDSGVKEVVVALRSGSASAAKAEAAGLRVTTVPEAAGWADVIMILTPDELQAQLYRDDIRDNVKDGAALAFAHGLNIHFRLIEARPDLDVFMVAPKGPGHTVRALYETGGGVPCLLAVDQDATATPPRSGHPMPRRSVAVAPASSRPPSARNARPICLASMRAVRRPHRLDPGRLRRRWSEAGYAPEMAYFECLHEVKLIVDLIYEGGIANMRYSISNTAEYGDLTRGPRLIDDQVKSRMKEILDDIQSGRFAREWVLENAAGQASFKALRNRAAEHPIEEVGERLRAMMPWIKEQALVDKTKN